MQAGTLRSLPAQPKKGLVDFSSNDYLGLARSPRLQESSILCWQSAKYKDMPLNGSTGSRLLSGNSPALTSLESALASFFDAEAALFLGSGYVGMLGVLASLPTRHDLILYDQDIHACAKDGMRLSGARHIPYAHNDMDALYEKLKRHGKEALCRYVLTESLFSMRGDQVPLAECLDCCQAHNALLILDEAHSTGLLGSHGQGLAYEHQLHTHTYLRIHTFGKAWGTQGACVVGDKSVIDYLINFDRPFIYSTAPSPIQVHAVAESLRYFQQQETPIQAFWDRVDDFHKALEVLHPTEIRCEAQKGPVQALRLCLPKTKPLYCRALAAELQAKGYDVRAILPPTIRAGEEQLRICLHAFNTQEEIHGLFQALLSVLSQS